MPGGVLFGTQSVDGVIAGIEALEQAPVDRGALPALAEPFGIERFDREFASAFERHWRAWKERRPARLVDQLAEIAPSP